LTLQYQTGKPVTAGFSSKKGLILGREFYGPVKGHKEFIKSPLKIPCIQIYPYHWVRFPVPAKGIYIQSGKKLSPTPANRPQGGT
jgi:hypothetical protein